MRLPTQWSPITQENTEAEGERERDRHRQADRLPLSPASKWARDRQDLLLRARAHTHTHAHTDARAHTHTHTSLACKTGKARKRLAKAKMSHPLIVNLHTFRVDIER